MNYLQWNKFQTDHDFTCEMEFESNQAVDYLTNSLGFTPDQARALIAYGFECKAKRFVEANEIRSCFHALTLL